VKQFKDRSGVRDSMSAFDQAWETLLLQKAFEEHRGFFGTMPPAIRGMVDRRLAQGALGDVVHDAQGVPVEYGEGMGEAIPTGPMREGDMSPYRRIGRDQTTVLEPHQTMISATDAGAPGIYDEEGNVLDDSKKDAYVAPGVGLRSVPGYELMPEEGFATPREQYFGRQSMADASRRMLTGAQRGTRMDVQGGSKSGIFAPMRNIAGGAVEGSENRRMEGRMPTPQGMKRVGQRRSAATLGNEEGVTARAKLGGLSESFLTPEVIAAREGSQAPKPQAQAPPTPEEERESLAQRLASMAMEANPGISMNFDPTAMAREMVPDAPADPNADLFDEPVTPFNQLPRNDQLRDPNDPALVRTLRRIAQQKEAMSFQPGEKEAFFGTETDPATMEMFGGQRGGEEALARVRQLMMEEAKREAARQQAQGQLELTRAQQAAQAKTDQQS